MKEKGPSDLKRHGESSIFPTPAREVVFDRLSICFRRVAVGVARAGFPQTGASSLSRPPPSTDCK